MDNDITGEPVEDFFLSVMAATNADDIEQAVTLILDLADRQAQIDTLSQLANALVNANALARGSDLAPDLSRSRDLATIHALALDRALKLDLDLAADLAYALDLAHNLARAHAYPIRINRVILRVLEVLTNRTAVKYFPPSSEPAATSTSLSLVWIDTLTPQTLSAVVAPYLQAIADLQQVIHQITNVPPAPATIRHISDNLSVEFKMDGVAQAIDLLQKIVIPWRREHANMREQLKTDMHFPEREQRKLELDNARSEMALEIVKRIAPELPEEKRLAAVNDLLKALTVPLESPLQIQ
ncbi:MAG: hypothetical protein U0694_04810 [Anaerolineae bacterium]